QTCSSAGTAENPGVSRRTHVARSSAPQRPRATRQHTPETPHHRRSWNGQGRTSGVRRGGGAVLRGAARPRHRGEHPHAAREPAEFSPPSVHSRPPVIHSKSAHSPLVRRAIPKPL